jgi:iron complex outermembrane receptor protein
LVVVDTSAEVVNARGILMGIIRETGTRAGLLAPMMFAFVSAAFQAHSQTAIPGPSGSGSELAEILVTAEKRESTVQSTAISLTAISGKDLEARGTPSLADIAAAVPGVTLRSSGPGITEYEMRGLSSSAGSSPTVGFYLDETPLTAPAAAQWGKVVIDPNLYDVQRIEILRGPQGTLYGSGSMGGTIKIVPNSADVKAFDASADVQGSGTDGGGPNERASAMLNMPVNDEFAMRLVATTFEDSGWVDRIVEANFPPPQSATVRGNVLTGTPVADYRNVNEVREVSTRLSASYRPTDAVSITPTLLYQETKSGGLSAFDSSPGTEAHYQPFDFAEPSTDRTRLASIVFKYDLSSVGFVWSFADWKRELRLLQDQSENIAYFYVPTQTVYPPAGLGGSAIHEDDLMSQFSSELRVVSRGSGPLQWVAGVFFSNFNTEWDVYAVIPGAVTAFGSSNELLYYQPQNVKQKAVFGEAAYAFTDTLKFSLGARYFSYTDALETTQSGWASTTGSNAISSIGGSHDQSGFNPKGTLSYEPTADFTVFGTIAKGFRPGGGNGPVPTIGPSSCAASLAALGLTAAPAFYGSDSIVSYELGEKLRLLDRRITVNASVYHIDWSDVQQTVVLPICGYPFTGNEGKATVDGAEFEGIFALGAGLTASANVAYANAQLAENVPSTGGHKGDELQDTPSWTGSAAINYTQDVGNGLAMTARVGATYVGNRIDVTYARNELPEYTIADVRLKLAGSHWSGALFVDNFTNKIASINNVTALSVNLPTYNRVATNQPRTIGLQVHYNYK